MRVSKYIALIGLVSLPLAAVSQTPGVASDALPSPGDSRPPLPDFKDEKQPEPSYQLPPAPLDPPVRAPGQTQAQPSFTLNDLNFEGNTVFSAEELRSVVAGYLNQRVTNADLESIRLLLTQFYIDQGYVTSGALLPDQTISNGQVKYQIVEGELGAIRVSNQGRLSKNYIRDRLMLGAGPPINQNKFQDQFQLLLADPLIDRLDGRLQPGDQLGESILDIDVTRTDPYGLSLILDNHGSASTGAEQATLAGYIQNLTTLGDRLELDFTLKEGANYGNLGWQIPLNRYDTQFGLRYGTGDTEIVESSLEILDIESEYERMEVFLEHPYIKTLENEHTLGLKVSSTSNESFLLGEPFSFTAAEDNGESRASAARLYLNGATRGPSQVFSYALTISQGMSLLDATENGGDIPDSDFTSGLLQMQYARRVMDNGAQIRVRADAQFSQDPLLPQEQFAIGGASTVRGYRENLRVRDEGYIGSLEFVLPLNAANRDPMLGHFNLVAFVDYGDADNINAAPNEEDALFSAGLGLLWQYQDIASADLYYGHAINEVPESGDSTLQDDGIHLRLRFNAF